MYKRTGLPVHPMGPFYKLLYFKNEQSKIFDQAAYWVGIKEYIIWKYTGVLKEEISMAAATGLLNMKTRQWDEEALKETGVNEKQLPELVETTDKFQGIKSEYAKVIGIDKDVTLSWVPPMVPYQPLVSALFKLVSWQLISERQQLSEPLLTSRGLIPKGVCTATRL